MSDRIAVMYNEEFSMMPVKDIHKIGLAMTGASIEQSVCFMK